MSESTVGVITELNIDGPFIVKKGKNEGKNFYVHKLTINNEEYRSFDYRKSPEAPAEKGALVEVLFTTQAFNGNVSKNIEKLKVVGTKSEIHSEKLTSSPSATIPESKKSSFTPRSSESSASSHDETQTRIARSHAITTAINLLQLQGATNPSLIEAVELAEQVRKYTTTGNI